jgi:hypothetical protein
VLLVLDDGWAAAAEWPRRLAAAATALDRAERAGRKVALLTTAASETGAAPVASAVMPPAEMRGQLAALRPKPWAADRAAAAAALRAWRQDGGRNGGSVVYIADGLTDGPDWSGFSQAMAAAGPVREIRDAAAPAQLLLPPLSGADGFTAIVAQARHPAPTPVAVLGQSGDGRTLARVDFTIPAGAGEAQAPIKLPPELRNRLDRLVLGGAATAGGVVLLDERWRRRPVGLLAGDAITAGTPLIGELFYLQRALEPYTEVRRGDLSALLARQLSVLILADHPLPPGPEHDAVAAWVRKGGLLVRFAGPQTAAHPDSLLPVTLLEGDRQLGGAMSWSKPAALAPFPPDSPFDGLKVPADVRVREQVLAEPGAKLSQASWARLADGTPLVTQTALGSGRIVLFHVTANADWSDLPLSGLFVDMLRRLVALSGGVASAESAGTVPLAPDRTLDGFGQLGKPPAAAAALTGRELATAEAGPLHPPGLYGPENGRHALNLSTHLSLPEAAPPVPGASVQTLGAEAPERLLGPWLLAAALGLLAIDLLVSLRLRGLWRHAATAALLLGLCLPQMARADPGPPNPALQTRLAYVVTGDDRLDSVSRQGLAGLSEYVNERTAASLARPAGIVPGQDDLSFYPLIYWPISADAPALSGAAVAALNGYMAHGGIIVIDTRDSGSGQGFAPGANTALTRLARGLDIPELAPLTTAHVLAHAFYLLQDFPGRYTGDTVWVQRDQDRTNDSVSPVIIGGNDWAAAWAVDAGGRNPYAVIPGGDRQRTIAYRFGVNLVMYALTGNYKGDQVHVPALLERLGQ